ncbi:MAG: oxygen-dependent tRNA uridine(34) hydroxylase TrhO [Verrucomicrobiales bacterium]
MAHKTLTQGKSRRKPRFLNRCDPQISWFNSDIENDIPEPFQVLLYYRYGKIEDTEKYLADHRTLCERLELRGRILIGDEGLNGTVSGNIPNTEAYVEALHDDPFTADMPFKIDPCGEGHIFPKLSIKIRHEIVRLGLPNEADIDPNQTTGTHLAPVDFYNAMQEENTVLIDARNDYESELGHFKGALRPNVGNFRDFPQWLEDNAEALAGKKILTYCTGGIRCEKFSGFIKKSGYDDVYQLDGGIINYSHDPATRGRNFDGLCYVFDERVGVEVNHTDSHAIVTHCKHCDQPIPRYRNCGWAECNAQTFICESCEESFGKFCSEACRDKFSNKMAKEPVTD